MNRLALPLASIVLVSLGCAARPHTHSELVRLSAGVVGCAPEDMTSTAERRGTRHLTWGVVCRSGVRYECIARGGITRCTVDLASAGAEPMTTPQSIAAPQVSGSVRRTRTDAGWALDSTVALDGAIVSLHSVPSADPRRAWWSIRIPGGGDTECTSRVLVDGTAVDLAVESRHPTQAGEEVRSLIAVDLLVALADASRAIGQTCGQQWTVPDGARAYLRAFAQRHAEEVALTRP